MAGGFWSGSTPWWATVAIALVATGTALFVMIRNNNAAKQRDLDKRAADDRRTDRLTAASVQGACDGFYRAFREYYETWQASSNPDYGISADTVAETRNRARTASDLLHTELLRAQVVLNSAELVALGDSMDDEAQVLLHKISTYEQGLGFRLPLPGSTDLLFAGVGEKLHEYMEASKRVTRD